MSKKRLVHTSWILAVAIALVTHIFGLWCIQDLTIPGQTVVRGHTGVKELEELEISLEEWDLFEEEEVIALVSNEMQVISTVEEQKSASLDRMALSLVEEMPNEVPVLQTQPALLSASLPVDSSVFEYELPSNLGELDSWQVEPEAQEFAVLTELGDSLDLELDQSSIDDEPGLAVLASTKHYEVDVEYAPLSTSEGFAFRIRFLPVHGEELREIRQNITFLFDRSHSIERERFEATRRAVSKALQSMEETTYFNIVMFDRKVYPFTSQPVPATKANVASAQAFLNEQTPGGIGASTDLYQSLVDIVPEVVEEKEVNTVILLSDGDTYLREHQQRRAIGRWLDNNQGKVALFSVAAGPENNIPMLGLLSTYNKGRVYYTSKYSGINRSLAKIMRKIQHPLGKEIVASAVTNQGNIEIYPRPSRLPDLYSGVPYEIVGTTETLDEFYVFLQGKYYDRWLDIKHKISFENARRASPELSSLLAHQKAYDHYDAFIAEGKRQHLHRARELLAPHKIKTAFR